jgi:hypothetical protein
MVLAQERRDAILYALLPLGAATVADLADGLGVSEMTIRWRSIVADVGLSTRLVDPRPLRPSAEGTAS